MPLMAEEFARQVLRIAVAQIARTKEVGDVDASAEGEAFEKLVEVVGHYIEHIGLLTRRFSEHDGRTVSNKRDLLQAFAQMRPHRIDWRDLARMCKEVPWQVPSTSGIPYFPVDRRPIRGPKYGDQEKRGASDIRAEEIVRAAKKQKLSDGKPNATAVNGINEDGEEMKDGSTDHPGYVPSHFPNFPEKHTYSYTYVNAKERETDPKAILEKNLDNKRRVQEALVKLSYTEPKNKAFFGQEQKSSSSSSSQNPGNASKSTPAIPTAFH